MSEISVGDPRSRHLLRTALQDNPSFQHTYDPAGDLDRAIEILLDEQNSRVRRDEGL